MIHLCLETIAQSTLKRSHLQSQREDLIGKWRPSTLGIKREPGCQDSIRSPGEQLVDKKIPATSKTINKLELSDLSTLLL